MSVFHVLKDGSEKEDIKGHVVRLEDAGPLYRLINDINRDRSAEKTTYDNSGGLNHEF